MLTRLIALAVVVGPALACGANTSLAGFTMSFSTVYRELGDPNDNLLDESADVSFGPTSFDPQRDECPSISSDALRVDGETVESGSIDTGGVGWWLPVFGVSCNSIVAYLELAEEERDVEIVVDSGADTVRYVGTNLLTRRTFDPEAARAGRETSWRLRHLPATDVFNDEVTPTARLVSTSEQLEVTRDDDGALSVGIPASVPAGAQTVEVFAEYTVPALACENLSDCTVRVRTHQELALTVE